MTAPELKPCPFCGRAMEITDDLRHYNHPVSACFGRHISIAASDIDRIEMWNRRADLAAIQTMQGVWNKCTFDLSGAGYDCVLKDGYARHGAYGEGQKVFWDGTTINADGLYILSKPALDKRIAAAQPAHVHPDPRDEVIARLVDALRLMRSTYPYNPPCYGWVEQVEAHKTAKAALAAAKEVMK